MISDIRICKFLGESRPRLRTNTLYYYSKDCRKNRNENTYSCSYAIYEINSINIVQAYCGEDWFKENFIDIQEQRKLKLQNIYKKSK